MKCRTCTIVYTGENVKHLDEQITIYGTRKKLCEVVSASVQIIDNDKLPQLICNICVDKACTSYLFIQMVTESQKVLLESLVKLEEAGFPVNDNFSDEEIGLASVTAVLEPNIGLAVEESVLTFQDTSLEQPFIEPDKTIEDIVDSKFNSLQAGPSSDLSGNIGSILFVPCGMEDQTELKSEPNSKKSSRKSSTYYPEKEESYTVSTAVKPCSTNSSEVGAGKYQCPHCPRYFDKRRSYASHIRDDHEIAPFNTKCYEPNITIEEGNPLKGHTAKRKRTSKTEVHSEEIKHQCPHCSRSFYKKQNHANHVKKCPAANKFQCEICNQVFHTHASRATHMKLHKLSTFSNKRNEIVLNSYANSCVECCEKFTTSELLKKHHKKHDAYNCRICCREFTKSSNLIEHLKCHKDFEYISYFEIAKTVEKSPTNDNTIDNSIKASYDCDKCDQVFPTVAQVEIHKTCHPPYICQHCGLIYNHSNTLANHVFEAHGQSDAICKPCVECDEVFYSQDTLRTHYVSHKKFSCKTCPVQFKTHSQLCYHLLYNCETQPDDTVYKCKCCNVQFQNRDMLVEHCEKRIDQCCQYCGLKQSQSSIKKHLDSHTSADVGFVCFVSTCKEQFFTSTELDEHLTTHDVFACGDCNEELNSLENLREHYFGKSCPLAIECKECGFSFENRQLYLLHCNMHSGEVVKSTEEKIFLELENTNVSMENECSDDEVSTPAEIIHKCVICDIDFSNLEDLQFHIRAEHDSQDDPYACRYCYFVGGNTAILTKHMYSEHSIYKTWFCKQCDSGFFSSKSLRTHELTHRGIRHICDVCGRSYISAKNLTIHMRNHTGEKPYKCHICEKTFTQHSTLRYHLLFHGDKRDFQCDLCGISFHIRGALLAHKRRHTGESKVECNLCGKRFCDKSTLKKHFSVHTGEKNYPCTVCGKAFSRGFALTVHMRAHTGERPYGCTVCEKRFIQKHVLQSHMNTHHKVAEAD